MFGEPDGEDDVGDEEEGAAAQAEPESVLQGENTGVPAELCVERQPSGFGEPGGGWLWGVRAAHGPGCPEFALFGAGMLCAGPLQTDEDSILTQGSVMRSHRITRPLSRAVASGWHEATSSLSCNKKWR